MDNFYNSHYILIDENNNIVDGWSNGPHYNKDTTNAICINDKGGYQFRLFPDGEENPSLFDWDTMVPLYKWDGTQVIKRSEDEVNIDKQSVASQVVEIPSQLDIIEAQVTYTAMMTNTLLEV